jgi:hypothetical protein
MVMGTKYFVSHFSLIKKILKHWYFQHPKMEMQACTPKFDILHLPPYSHFALHPDPIINDKQCAQDLVI